MKDDTIYLLILIIIAIISTFLTGLVMGIGNANNRFGSINATEVQRIFNLGNATDTIFSNTANTLGINKSELLLDCAPASKHMGLAICVIRSDRTEYVGNVTLAMNYTLPLNGAIRR